MAIETLYKIAIGLEDDWCLILAVSVHHFQLLVESIGRDDQSKWNYAHVY